MNWNSPVADEVLALRFGLKFEFDLGGGEQIFEARAGRLRRLPDRAGDSRAAALIAAGCRRRSFGGDRHDADLALNRRPWRLPRVLPNC